MTENTAPTTGMILHLQRLSTEDGPGIRTTVFYKGCPLHCAWCHNPESISIKPQVQWIGNRCIGCNTCIETCKQKALTKTPDGIVRSAERCILCGECVEACPSGAMEMLGQEITVDDLVNELVKDRAYFEKSGGGVTLSGGEPSLQPVFTLAVMKALKEKGVSVALDTCGFCQTDTLEKLAAEADIILFDLKLIDSQEHQKWTGVSNEHILENLILVKNLIQASNGSKRLWIRTPLIPQATDHSENIQGINVHLAQYLDGTVERWELCAFNNLCRDKYQRLGMSWKFSETPLMTKQDLERVEQWMEAGSFSPERVFVTGAARVEN